MVLGAIVAWQFLNWLKKLSNKKILSRLENGFNNQGDSFLKRPKVEKEVYNGEEKNIRDEITRELIGDPPKPPRGKSDFEGQTRPDGIYGTDKRRDNIQEIVDSVADQDEPEHRPNRKKTYRLS